ncbi:HlyD family secretion protein [Flammeovirga sp. OC4]|uniref:HlyD family secretion protein n=1 Tax=Flammeovirga sp. OC4 TaxID=1382345 RepID=UPI0005C4E770|nr:HlyD family efflux transporter periplasmic adaptor subunit [Flammeovirga sp. OC4]
MENDDLNENDLLEKSEEYEDIISRMPNSLIMWGSTFIFFFFLMILILSYLVKFPDIIKGDVTITSIPSPQKVISKTTGQLNIFVEEGQLVEKDQVIATIDDVENIWNEVLYLDGVLIKFLAENDISKSSIKKVLNETDKMSLLGELNQEYSLWRRALREYVIINNNNLLKNKKKNIRTQINEYKNLNNNLLSQVDIHSKEMEISDKLYQRDSLLRQEKVISASDFENAEYKHLQIHRQKVASEAQIISNEITLSELSNSINELSIQERKESLKLINEIINRSIALRNAIIDWKQRHLLTSKINGHVAFLDFLINQQFVQANNSLFSVIPLEYSLKAKVKIPSTNFGKVSQGQKVNIKLEAYPFEEYGMVNGEISHIYQFTKDDKYLCEVKLRNGIKTSYQKELKYKQDLVGTAQIITNDYNLIDHFFYQFRQIEFTE